MRLLQKLLTSKDNNFKIKTNIRHFIAIKNIRKYSGSINKII